MTTELLELTAKQVLTMTVGCDIAAEGPDIAHHLAAEYLRDAAARHSVQEATEEQVAWFVEFVQRHH